LTEFAKRDAIEEVIATGSYGRSKLERMVARQLRIKPGVLEVTRQDHRIDSVESSGLAFRL